MTKDVLVKVSGLQFAGEEDSDAIEVITSGTYYKKNGKHYVLYEEVSEDGDVTKNTIKIWDKSMDVTRKGSASVHMMFEQGKKNVSYYYTPFGNLLIGIDAKDVQITETENEIVVKVKYGLDINYEHTANCHITVSVMAKEAREFKL